MNTDKYRLESDKITEKIIGCAYTVANTLGSGFLEKVYENALAHELCKAGLKVTRQASIRIHYDTIVAGEYTADLLVNDSVIIELKAVKNLDSVHTAQCLNYLKATKRKICLLINFGKPKIDIKRIVNNY
ncbi:MAG: GxxExxY protein [Sedimentisphaerales bacterium]|nr:GxxExxY protein [Sedimentisphaerales bacterium]